MHSCQQDWMQLPACPQMTRNRKTSNVLDLLRKENLSANIYGSSSISAAGSFFYNQGRLIEMVKEESRRENNCSDFKIL